MPQPLRMSSRHLVLAMSASASLGTYLCKGPRVLREGRRSAEAVGIV